MYIFKQAIVHQAITNVFCMFWNAGINADILHEVFNLCIAQAFHIVIILVVQFRLYAKVTGHA